MSHEATDIICSSYGITDYFPTMRALDADPTYFDGADPQIVDLMVKRVGSALGASNIFPGWAMPYSPKA